MSNHQLLNQGSLLENDIVLDRFEIEFDGLFDIGQGFILGISLADTARQGWDIDSITAFFAGFKNDLQVHFLMIVLLLLI